jgi:phosphoglycolate phosphatase-like HAD superfamily hydrolase
MHQLNNYDVIIFDCDGVILDSNKLKISAMYQALSGLSSDQSAVDKSVSYFKNNFGKSRFHHIDVFAKEIFKLNDSDSMVFKEEALNAYSGHCKSLYLRSDLTPGILSLFNYLSGKNLYVASGSEQQELNDVFKRRKLDHYFVEILGSPTPKVENIKSIINSNKSARHLMIGDAVSDHESAKNNDIDFVFYAPYSNVKSKMLELSKVHGFPVIHDFSEVLSNG